MTLLFVTAILYFADRFKCRDLSAEGVRKRLYFLSFQVAQTFLLLHQDLLLSHRILRILL